MEITVVLGMSLTRLEVDDLEIFGIVPLEGTTKWVVIYPTVTLAPQKWAFPDVISMDPL